MPRSIKLHVIALATACLAASSALANDGSGALAWADDLSVARLFGTLLGLVSPPLLVGFLLGLACAELGRMAWKTSQGIWKATVAFSSTAAQYGAIAAVLACVLYFA